MSDKSIFFQRYRPQDPHALASKIERDSQLLKKALVANDEQLQLELLSKMGANYTMLEQEEKAVSLLEQALLLARRRAAKYSIPLR